MISISPHGYFFCTALYFSRPAAKSLKVVAYECLFSTWNLRVKALFKTDLELGLIDLQLAEA